MRWTKKLNNYPKRKTLNSTLKLTINLSEDYPFITDKIWEALGDSKEGEVVLWFEDNKFEIQIWS